MAPSDRYARLRATRTFAGDAHRRWCEAVIAVIGVGALGGPFSRETVRSGASVRIYDPDEGEEGNRGTQEVAVGQPKAVSQAGACNAIAPGSAEGWSLDVRDVGPGGLRRVDLIVDCTDDRSLAYPLTLISNGWSIPLLRLAVDGSGGRELGRVLVSHGGAGHACQLCGMTPSEAFEPTGRTPCPGGAAERAPTLAGSALAMAVAGMGLLTAQRLVGGNGAEDALDRETYLDLDTPQILPMRLARNDACLSGHRQYDPVHLRDGPETASLASIFSLARRALASESVGLRIEGHPLLLEARCACGHAFPAPGTRAGRPPDCPRCGSTAHRRPDIRLERFNEAQARALGILGLTLAELGAPAGGVLVTAQAEGRAGIHFLLDGAPR